MAGSTRVLGVSIWTTSSLEEDDTFGFVLDRVQASRRVMPTVSKNDAKGP